MSTKKRKNYDGAREKFSQFLYKTTRQTIENMLLYTCEKEIDNYEDDEL